MPAELIAPALAAGNAVVWNPALLTVALLGRARRLHPRGGPAAGVFNLVTGPGDEVGDEIAADPRVAAVGFVGSDHDRERDRPARRGQGALLEMGGNGPLVDPRRRRPRRGRRRDDHRLLPQRGPELHRRRAGPRRPARPRGVPRAARRRRRHRRCDSAIPSTAPPRWARSTTSGPREDRAPRRRGDRARRDAPRRRPSSAPARQPALLRADDPRSA